MYRNQLLSRFFAEWVDTYKKGAVTQVTLCKYRMTQRQLELLAPETTLADLTRLEYQRILNQYAADHERQTVMDFHHQVRAAVLDAVEDGVIRHDPTRKAVIKGKDKAERKPKFLNQHELANLLAALTVDADHPTDSMLMLIAKTGLRFAEALGVTPGDFDFHHQTLRVSKTWNYKSPNGGFAPTKNASSNRLVRLDWMLCMQMKQLCEGQSQEKPLFIKEGERVFNATVNDRLAALCRKNEIPVISVHGLRHTHASLLLYAGVSVASVAKRLGHSNMTTTQTTYLHIIKELESQDNDKVMQFLSTL